MGRTLAASAADAASVARQLIQKIVDAVLHETRWRSAQTARDRDTTGTSDRGASRCDARVEPEVLAQVEPGGVPCSSSCWNHRYAHLARCEQ
jgi:hypothetical protein